MKYLPAAAFACALLTVPGAASAVSDTKVFGSVTEADLKAIVAAEGHTLVESDAVNELPTVQAKDADGLIYVLFGTACDEQATRHCNGIMMQVQYDSDGTITGDQVNEANKAVAAVQTYHVTDAKLLGFNRYMVLDGGVTWLNIRENLRVLLEGSQYAYYAVLGPEE